LISRRAAWLFEQPHSSAARRTVRPFGAFARARGRHRPSRPQPSNIIVSEKGLMKLLRFRPRETERTGRRGRGRCHAGTKREDRRGNGLGHRPVHVAGAGRRQDARSPGRVCLPPPATESSRRKTERRRSNWRPWSTRRSWSQTFACQDPFLRSTCAATSTPARCR